MKWTGLYTHPANRADSAGLDRHPDALAQRRQAERQPKTRLGELDRLDGRGRGEASCGPDQAHAIIALRQEGVNLPASHSFAADDYEIPVRAVQLPLLTHQPQFITVILGKAVQEVMDLSNLVRRDSVGQRGDRS